MNMVSRRRASGKKKGPCSGPFLLEKADSQALLTYHLSTLAMSLPTAAQRESKKRLNMAFLL